MPSPSGSAAGETITTPPVEFTLYVRRLIGPVAVHVHVDFNASKSANGLRLFAGPPFVRGSAHIAIEASGTISGTAIGRNFGNGFALTLDTASTFTAFLVSAQGTTGSGHSPAELKASTRSPSPMRKGDLPILGSHY